MKRAIKNKNYNESDEFDIMKGFSKVVRSVIRKSDIILMVCDVRLADDSINQNLESNVLRMKKRIIYVFNKIDLADKQYLEEIMKKYPWAYFVSANLNIGIKNLRNQLFILSKKLKLKDPKIGVIGYPNLGKSSLINAIARSAKAKISNFAGTTRGVQWIKVSNMKILDTPGVIDFKGKKNKLGRLGSINAEEIEFPEKIALEIIKDLLIEKPSKLKKVYNFDNIINGQEDEDYEIFLEIGKKRGFLKKGGVVDEKKTAITIIRDWQKGKFND